MSTKFKELVKKKKSELVEIADFNSASQIKKTKLIKKLADDISKKKLELLDLNAKEVRNRAKEFGIEYTTKKETLSKIAEKLEQQEADDSSEENETTWEEEFQYAISVAKRNTLSEKRSYKILETDEENTFNISPTYMKHPEEYNLLLSINITEYAKQQLS